LAGTLHDLLGRGISLLLVPKANLTSFILEGGIGQLGAFIGSLLVHLVLVLYLLILRVDRQGSRA
jgi:hypothetical protein